MSDFFANFSEDTRKLNPEVIDIVRNSSKRKHKYNAQKAEIDGIVFDSKKEARRYLVLKGYENTGVIENLKLQPRYELQGKFKDSTGNKHRAITFVADFEYEVEGKTIVEDTKGVETAVFKIKKKLFLFKYPHLTLRIT